MYAGFSVSYVGPVPPLLGSAMWGCALLWAVGCGLWAVGYGAIGALAVLEAGPDRVVEVKVRCREKGES